MGRRFLALAVAVALVFVAGACSSGDTDISSPTTVAAGVQPANTVVLDVRTPAEYAEGHLQGAENYDVTAADFDARIASLDKGGHYEVYCRTGNRSAQAVARMKAAGFTDVTDLGGIDAAASTTGIAIVTK